ncbi:hypothetical protein I545_1501 [Mycobacterium kansasii 662]|uniref:Uncharacterized protein n=2 Tax=Mycobacterium kansasii TaxID=1768 RepID=A0A7G1IKI0_MYCKA|nr:hypothetical protein I545_1501 [Mycobacterium kansasii 662]BCI89168.1 hypothetical protein NIIDMKKI_43740 [Mycobacterium kansasii]
MIRTGESEAPTETIPTSDSEARTEAIRLDHDETKPDHKPKQD